MPGTSININTTVIVHGGSVQITVTNDGSTVLPSNADWIACYSPANADIAATTPIRYQFANWSGTWGNAGLPAITTCNFKLNNLHHDYACYLFSGGLKSAPTLPLSSAYSKNPQYTGVPSYPKPFTSIVGSIPSFKLLAGPSAPISFDVPNLPTNIRVTPATCPPASTNHSTAPLCFNIAWNQVLRTLKSNKR